MADRRTVLRGLAVLPLVAAPTVAMASTVPADTRFVEMQRTAMALQAYATLPDTDGARGDTAYAKSSDLQHEAIDLTVTKPAGALASLIWGREEFHRYYIAEPGNAADWMDHFTLKMMDNAIAVLRARVASV